MAIYAFLIEMDGFLQGFSLLVAVYFAGLFISRIGSFSEKLFIYLPNEKKKKWWQFERNSYKDFLVAEQQDEKLSILVSQANIYRSMMSLFTTLLFIYLIETFLPSTRREVYVIITIIVTSAVLFYFSWIKQQEYIRKRIERAVGASNIKRG